MMNNVIVVLSTTQADANEQSSPRQYWKLFWRLLLTGSLHTDTLSGEKDSLLEQICSMTLSLSLGTFLSTLKLLIYKHCPTAV